jgi:hypothetical protein
MADIMGLRDYQFTLQQISMLVTKADLSDTIDAYEQQTKVLQTEIDHLQTKLLKLSQSVTTLKYLEQHQEQVDFEVSPALYFQPMEKYGERDGLKDDRGFPAERLNSLKSLTNFPIGFTCQLTNDADLQHVEWGLMVTHEEARRLVPEQKSSYQLLAPSYCVHTYLIAGPEGTLKAAYNELIKQLTDRFNLSIIGEPFGRIMLRCHEKEVRKRYFEIWCPISDLCYAENQSGKR